MTNAYGNIETLKENLSQFALLRKNNFSSKSIKKEYRYSSFEEFILTEGHEFKSAPFDEKKYEYATRTSKECFSNATNLAISNPELTYVEGYIFYVIPILHAWCVDSNGTVVDPTLKDSENHSYIGVPFTTEYLHKTISETGYYGLIENYKDQFWLLKKSAENYKKEIL